MEKKVQKVQYETPQIVTYEKDEILKQMPVMGNGGSIGSGLLP